MKQHWVPAVFMRGGTSKGVFFREDVLPARGPERDALFLSVIGSPDPYRRQLDGMGGGISSLSKVISAQASPRPDADVEFTFGQVAVDAPVVDYSANCGNLSAAVGLFAVNESLVPRPADGRVTLRIHNTNTNSLLRSTFEVSNGSAAQIGDLSIPGVAGTGPSVRLDYLDPGGSTTGALLPTGSATTTLSVGESQVTVSCVDATVPMVFVLAEDLGLTRTESIDELANNADVMDTLDDLRCAGAVAMGMATEPTEVAMASPKIAVVGVPSDYHTISGDSVPRSSFDIAVRTISMEQVHRAVPGIGGLCLVAATQIAGSIPQRLAGSGSGCPVRLGTPSGIVTAESDVRHDGQQFIAHSASMYRTARTLMRGEVSAVFE